MYRLVLIFLLGFISVGWTQSNSEDSKYLEDQFYLGFTYNFLLDKPEGVNHRNFSYGLQGGFIKDIPFNINRNIGFGIGLGYAVNSYYTNIVASKEPNSIEYNIELENFKRSKLETHLIEAPIEFRWRSSDASDYKFWRIYTGIKFGYVLAARSKFVSESVKLSFPNSDVRNFHYGLTFNFGYNTFNFQAYYALNNLFEEQASLLDGGTMDFKPLRIGIIFYIL